MEIKNKTTFKSPDGVDLEHKHLPPYTTDAYERKIDRLRDQYSGRKTAFNDNLDQRVNEGKYEHSQTSGPVDVDGESRWFSSKMCEGSFSFSAVRGTVDSTYYSGLPGTQVTVTCTPALAHEFSQWSDGNTDNPRTFTVTSTSNTEFIAKCKHIDVPYLTFEGPTLDQVLDPNEAFTSLVIYEGAGVEVSDDHENWSSANVGLSTSNPVTDGKIYVRAKTGSTRLSTIVGNFTKVSGNLADLVDYETRASGTLPTLSDNQFSYTDGTVYRGLFHYSDASSTVAADKLVDASELEFPWTSLSKDCFAYMFKDCVSLTEMPSLDNIQTCSGCYIEMFSNTKLKTASIAGMSGDSTNSGQDLMSMFQNCTSLVNLSLNFSGSIGAGFGIMQSLCSGCTALVKVSITFDTGAHFESDCGMKEAFKGCSLLSDLTLSFHNVGGVQSSTTHTNDAENYDFMYNTFVSCESLKKPKITVDGVLYPRAFKGGIRADDDTVTATIGWDPYIEDASGISIVSSEAGIDSLLGMFCKCVNLTKSPILNISTMHSDSTEDTKYGVCNSMFTGCSSLTDVSGLSLNTAIILAYSYAYMFQDCTSLITAPAVNVTMNGQPAPTGSYYCMFHRCTSLVAPPPNVYIFSTGAFTVSMESNVCYKMFAGCSKLTTPPALTFGAHAEKSGTFSYMFAMCKSLTTAPNLVNIQNVASSYGVFNRMYYGCTNLMGPVKVPFTSIGSSVAKEMFTGSGTVHPISQYPQGEACSKVELGMYNQTGWDTYAGVDPNYWWVHE